MTTPTLPAVPSGTSSVLTGRDKAEIDAQAALTRANLGVEVAGQIGGSVSSPTVLGIRETSGPTLLTTGEIDDGQFIKRVGTALVGHTLAASDVGLGSVTNAAQLTTGQLGAASGVASLDSSSLVVQNPTNATATPTAIKIPIADGSASLNGWITSPLSLVTIAPSLIKAISDGVTAIQFTKADGTTVVLDLDTTNGRLGINTVAPLTRLHIVNTDNSSPRGILSMQISSDTVSARVGCAKARGTIAAPTTVLTGDVLGRWLVRAYDGTNYLEMGSIEIQAEGTVGTGQIPTNLIISTATNANPSVLTQRLKIDSAGNVTISGTLAVTGNSSFFGAPAPTALTPTTGTFTPTFSANSLFTMTLDGADTLANPDVMQPGQTGRIAITQDVAGTGTLAYGTYWVTTNGVKPTITTTSGALDILTYDVIDSTHVFFTISPAVA